MSETKITCVCSQIKIPDLSLVLRRGDVVSVPTERALRSEDLKAAVRLSAVTREVVQRKYREITATRRHAPPWLNRNPNVLYKKIELEKPVMRVPKKPKTTPTAQTEVKTQAEIKKFAQVVREVVAGEIESQLEKQIGALKKELINEFSQIISSSIEVMGAKILRSISQQPVGVRAVQQSQITEIEDDEPPLIFIPTIRTSEGDVSVDSEENETSTNSVTEALRALKEAKKM